MTSTEPPQGPSFADHHATLDPQGWRPFIRFESCLNLTEVAAYDAAAIFPPTLDTLDDTLALVCDATRRTLTALQRDALLFVGGTDWYEGGRLCSKLPAILRLAESAGFHLMDQIVWDKGAPLHPDEQSYLTLHILARGQRFAQAAGRRGGVYHLTPPSWYSVGLPPALIHRAFQPWVVPGDRLIVPFAGSGTVLWQAMRLGLDAVGYEIDSEWDVIEALERSWNINMTGPFPPVDHAGMNGLNGSGVPAGLNGNSHQNGFGH